jgi:predicted NBD/HSP70 family sugar kinase
MGNHPTGSRDLIRAINRSAVLNTIRTNGPISRTQVARLTGLSPATISGITAELMEDDLIFEKAAGDSRGGRRPILLALNPRAGYVVGLKLTEDHVVGAITDLEATVIANHTGHLRDHALDTAITVLADVVGALVVEAGITKDRLLGVGVGLAGITDARHGVLRHSPIFGWRNAPFAELLRARLDVLVHIDNDVNTLTVTEQLFGAGQGVENFLTVTVGRGVGMGIVVNGQLYRGLNGGAGEFGHTVLDPDGPPCACGNRGCLETYVSDPSLVRLAAEAASRGELDEEVRDVEDLLTRAQQGNRAAQAVFAQAGEALGRGIANLINIFSPELVIISGEGVRAGGTLFGPMREAISRHVMFGLAEATEIRIDVWEDDAWARGAAGLVLEEIFRSPFHRDQPPPLRS